MKEIIRAKQLSWALLLCALIACGPGQGGSPPSVADGSQDEAAFLFEGDEVHTFELELSEENLEYLNAYPAREEYVQGSLVFAGEHVAPVGIRYKGGIGSFVGCVVPGPGGLLDVSGRKICAKLGIKVSLNRFVEEGRWKGLKKLQFHAMNQDATYLKERLGYNLFQDFQVASPRVAHARIVVNGEYAGLFALVEQIDSRFTRSRFAEIDGGGGNLYKDFWPGRTGDEEDILTTVRPVSNLSSALRTNQDDLDLTHDTMVNFGIQFRAAQERGPEEIDRVVQAWIDLDYMQRWIAVDRALEHDDGPMHVFAPGVVGSIWTGLGWNHNYYWYAADQQDRLWPIAWDLDLTLGALTNGWIEVEWNDLDLECRLTRLPFAFLPPSVPPSCEPLIRSFARQRASWERAVRELVEGPFSETEMNQNLDTWIEQLDPYVQEEIDAGIRGGGIGQWRSQVARFREYVADRRADLASSIED
jgi:hypothetical protein